MTPQKGCWAIILIPGLLIGPVGCDHPSQSAQPCAATRFADDARTADYDTEIDRLVRALPRVIEQMGWAQMNLRDELTALCATALTADDRTVHIRARQTARGHVRVQAVVGLQGDAVAQQTFYRVLREHLVASRSR